MIELAIRHTRLDFVRDDERLVVQNLRRELAVLRAQSVRAKQARRDLIGAFLSRPYMNGYAVGDLGLDRHLRHVRNDAGQGQRIGLGQVHRA